MTDKITLSQVGTLIDTTTAQTTINNNFTTIETAMNNTLSRDGTQPNTMQNTLDMNSNQIINLPSPATVNSPIRLQDLNTFAGGGTINTTPISGNGIVITGGGVTPAKVALRDILNIKDFGAVCNGSTDDTSAIQSAINSLGSSGGIINIPACSTVISSPLTITTNNVVIQGAGRNATTIISSSSGNSITVSTGLSGITLRGFTLNRTTVANSSQNGIFFTGETDVAFIEDVAVTNHYNGFRFGTTGYSYIHNCVASNNYNDGFFFTNSDAAGTGCQYTIEKCEAQQNNGYGFHFSSTTAAMSLGDMNDCTTFSNTLGGAYFSGTSNSNRIDGVRWNGGIVGQDGNHGLKFDSFNNATNRIEGILFELAGTSATGRNLATSISNVGCGVFSTANNSAIQIVGCTFTGNSWNGVETNATYTLISGCEARLNGAAGLAGEKNGYYCAAGTVEIVGSRAVAHGSFGAFLNTDGHLVVGNDFSGNTSSGIGAGVTLSTAIVGANLGSVINTIGNNLWGGATIAEAVVASASTTDIGNTTSLRVSITGTTGITSLGTAVNTVKFVRFTGALTITNNGTSLILPGGVNKTTVAGDTAIFESDASGNWRCVGYFPTTNGQITGTATNDNAATGNIGEYIESVIAVGSAVSLTTSTPVNLTSISLTAGDWDIDAVFDFIGGTTTTVSSIAGSLSTTTSTHDFTNGRGSAVAYANVVPFNQLAAGQAVTVIVPPIRRSLSSTTSIFGVASSIFGTSTCTVYGIIRARRVR